MSSGKVAIVTGGASGIGREMCLYLGERGATVVLADLDTGLAEKTAAEVRAKGGACTVETVDVTDRARVEQLIAKAKADFGRIDLLINNAGIGLDGELKDVTFEQFKKVVDVDFWGVVHGTLAAYPIMISQGFGQIVNVSSLAGLLPGGLMTSYVASKQAVTGFSLSLRSEARQYGVRVNALCPGFMETPIHDHTPKVSAYLRSETNQRNRQHFPTPDKCIHGMMKGIERDRAIIISPAGQRAFWWLYRLFPALVPYVWSKIIARLKR